MRRIAGILGGLLLCVAGISAGDMARFENLGFSADGRYFVFGQYGLESGSRRPYAEIFAVDVPRNVFVNRGSFSQVFPVAPTLGDDGRKALYALNERTADLRRQLRVDYLQQGRPIYLRVLGEAQPAALDELQVLDFETGREYKARLVQSNRGTGAAAESSFVIHLEVRDRNGAVVLNRQVGTPSVWRKVSDYNIVQMILSPGERHLVIVVERLEPEASGELRIRYMVETLAF